MIRRPPRSTQSRSSAASDVYKRQVMRIMVFRRVSLVAAVLLGMLVLLGAAPAAGVSESARVSLDVAEPLTSVDDPVEITVRGFVDEIWVDAEIQVMVYG